MYRHAIHVLTTVTVLCCSNVLSAQSRTLTGHVFAYDPWAHLVKFASFVENQEIVVLRLDKGHGSPEFVKVSFSSFNTKQLSDKYFQGDTVLSIKARRSKKCDERLPAFFAKNEPIVEPGAVASSGVQHLPVKRKYRLTNAFSSEPRPDLQTLVCYEAETNKP